MSKSSKQLSVSSFNLMSAVTHASPINSQSAKSLITKLPSYVKNLSDFNIVVDSSNVEISSVSNSDTKIFTAQTGLPTFEPTIVVSSEFVPLYYQEKKTDQGNALSIKENSSIVNAKVSVEMLSQSEGSKQAVSASKEELKEYISNEDSFLSRLMTLLNSAHSSMNISAYVLTSFFQSEPMGSLYEILRKGGYPSSNIVNFTETKLWQQSLVELKRSLLSHSPDLVSENFTRNNISTDADPFLISDVENPPRELKRIWLNPYFTDLPDEQDLYSKDKLSDNINKLLKFCDKQYVNLTFANSLRRTQKGFATESLVNTFERSIFSQKVLDPYVESGRDVSIIANCLFKEANYSSFLTKKENSELLLSKYDFQVSDQGDNLQLWDHVVGRFPKSVLDVVKNPIGNKNSLVSFSQEYIEGNNADYFNVLTLEDNYLENSDITPGSFYYIDSSLITSDGKSFDLSRIDHLIEKTKSSHDTTKTILDAMGYNTVKVNQSTGYRERTLKRKISNELDFDSLVENLSAVGNLYQSYVTVATYDQGPVVTGFDINAMKISNFNDALGIRLAALICKAAVSPTQGYKSSANRLKVLLFLWIMNFAFLTSESVSTEVEIKNKITELLTSVRTRSSEYEISESSKEARTFPFKVGTVSVDSSDSVKAAEDARVKYIYEKSVGSRVFNLTASTGLWSKLVEIMKSVHQNTSIYVNEKTAYSGFSKIEYMFGYFDLILKIIASQTPEDLLGSYNSSYKYAITEGDRSVVVSESGLIVSNPKYLLNGMFDAKMILRNQSLTKTIRRLSDINKFLKAEEKLVMNEVLVYRRYLLDLGTTLQSFRDFLSKNFEDHLTKLKSLYDQDGSLNEKQKNAILNLTFTDEQVKLSRYIMSEISDRIKEDSDTESKLRSIPSFSTFPEKFTDFLPVRETDLISCTMLSSYFKNRQFLSKKGENKRILSIGIPPKLNRTIRTSSRLSTDSALNGLIRVKVFKIDRLLPDVIYKPQSYVFDMNRFPTRVISNWDYESFFNDDFNILRIPTKLMLSSGDAILHKDFNEAFPQELYGNILTQQDKLQIYANHSISLLSEEYMRWFTDCKFDETRYNNYSQLSNVLENLEDQYSKYLDLIKQTAQEKIDPKNEVTNQVVAEFFDPTSGQSFQIPVKKPGYTKSETASKKIETNKSFVIPLDKSLRTYFLNETFLSNTLVYKKMISYPKKFDRVFTVIVDPDDFYVDETMTSEKTLKSLKDIGLVSGGLNEDNDTFSPYKTREKDLGDVSLVEYFVTVEPFDYVQEYEG